MRWCFQASQRGPHYHLETHLKRYQMPRNRVVMDLPNLTHESEGTPQVCKEQLTHPVLLGFWKRHHIAMGTSTLNHWNPNLLLGTSYSGS